MKKLFPIMVLTLLSCNNSDYNTYEYIPQIQTDSTRVDSLVIKLTNKVQEIKQRKDSVNQNKIDVIQHQHFLDSIKVSNNIMRIESLRKELQITQKTHTAKPPIIIKDTIEIPVLDTLYLVDVDTLYLKLDNKVDTIIEHNSKKKLKKRK